MTGIDSRLHRRSFDKSFGTRFPRDRRYKIIKIRIKISKRILLINLINREFDCFSFFLSFSLSFFLGELNRAICWYLSCDRYWEDTKRQQRHTPWYLLTIFMVVLFSSIYACYYIIWVLFNSAEEDRLGDGSGSLDYTDGDITATSSSHEQTGSGESRSGGRRKGEPGDENMPISNEEMPDHYIYVTYPPELKQRLLDSCYNRTTRL